MLPPLSFLNLSPLGKLFKNLRLHAQPVHPFTAERKRVPEFLMGNPYTLVFGFITKRELAFLLMREQRLDSNSS